MLFDDAVLVGKIKKYNSYKGEHVILCNDSTAVDKENKFLILELDGLKVPFLIEESATKSNDTVNVRLAYIFREKRSKTAKVQTYRLPATLQASMFTIKPKVFWGQ